MRDILYPDDNFDINHEYCWTLFYQAPLFLRREKKLQCTGLDSKLSTSILIYNRCDSIDIEWLLAHWHTRKWNYSCEILSIFKKSTVFDDVIILSQTSLPYFVKRRQLGNPPSPLVDDVVYGWPLICVTDWLVYLHGK